MTTHATVTLSLLVAACSAPAPVPKSLCDLPRNLAGWSGYEIHWRGLILDAAPHGIAFISEDCRRRGLQVGRLSKNADAIYTLARQKASQTDWFQVDLTAKIIDGKLYIETFHKLDPIQEEEGQRRAKRLML